MELRGRKRQYIEDDSDADDTSSRGARASLDSGAPRPSVSANLHHSELAIAQRRASRAQRGRKSHGDDSDADDHEDALSEEKLQKQLRTVTDEKEIKRIKRLLRNRVSAQQARERKKQYVSELEQKIAERDETIGDLQRDLKQAAAANATLRRLIMTMRGPGHGTSARPRVAAAPERPPSALLRLQGGGGSYKGTIPVRPGSGLLAAPVVSSALRTTHSTTSQGTTSQGGGGGAPPSLRYSADSSQAHPLAQHSLRKLHGMPDNGSLQLSDDALIGGGREKASQDPLDLSLPFGNAGEWPAMRAPA